MAARIDNMRIATFFANKDNNHNHLRDHKRPALNVLIEVTEEITLKPGTKYYGPGLWCNTDTKYLKAETVIRIPNDTTKPVFSGGVKTNK